MTAGRIGRIHAANIAARDDVELRYVVDVDQASAKEFAGQHGAAVCSVEVALADKTLDAVVIGSPTDTHSDLISRSARAGKAIFCEKPIALTLVETDAMLEAVEKAGVLFQVGFMRRFDKGSQLAGQFGGVDHTDGNSFAMFELRIAR